MRGAGGSARSSGDQRGAAVIRNSGELQRGGMKEEEEEEEEREEPTGVEKEGMNTYERDEEREQGGGKVKLRELDVQRAGWPRSPGTTLVW